MQNIVPVLDPCLNAKVAHASHAQPRALSLREWELCGGGAFVGVVMRVDRLVAPTTVGNE